MGDIMPGGVFSQEYDRWAHDYLPDEAKTWFDNDVVFANLECAISNRGKPMENKILVYAFPDTLKILEEMRFNIINLANNHILDYGIEAAEDTKARLDALSIVHAGVGRNLAEASRPAILDCRGVRVAMLGYSWTSEWVQSVPAATEVSTGVNPLRLDHVLSQIRALRAEGSADIILVSLHWGQGKALFPEPRAVRQARAMIDAGADIIVGHHPHCLQGYEVYKGKPIFYSLGNFLCSHYFKLPNMWMTYNGDGAPRTRNLRERKTLIVNLELTDGRLSDLRFLPLVQHRDMPILTLPDENLGKGILRRFETVSSWLRRPDYPVSYHMLRRIDEIVRYGEDIREEGLKDLTWKTPFRVTRKLLTGRSMH